ncbi:alpha mannosidase-like protein [Entomortierella chlamydospora]|uniref:alpha-1,2-Mannosidase n=1 Tax=Entomortierella chlamydospora TaxID=101097 RepID=A0A9P6MTL4_9FUNG|nr:alpha mannosidase-like protein [Entomortierella chlamydospora]
MAGASDSLSNGSSDSACVSQEQASLEPKETFRRSSQTQKPEQQSRPPRIPSSSTDAQNRSNRTGSQGATGATNASGGIRPWILMVIFSVIQMLLSTHISNGVNASSSDRSADSTSGGGSSGNNYGGAGSYNRHYFRQLPRIKDPTRAAGTIVTERMTESRRLTLRQEAKDMFMHGYNGYLNNAFPKDELNPVACNGRGSDKYDPQNININDVLGDYSLTLIDALDTLAAMREPELFEKAIRMVKKYVRDFNINSRVQVFEVNIRVLGALLSAHLYASDPSFNITVRGYNGELLAMAEDLGKRLMKAFENTPTGIPWPRVNLRKGVSRDELVETCTAGAGSLLLEFGVLSRLTGNESYEQAARRAVFELWNRRSKIGLMGNTINITSGDWMSVMTGIGAGTDSFYEYLIKSYVLLGGEDYLKMYEASQEAIRRNLLHDSKYFYKHVHLEDGSLMAHWVDSLSAFMPGVQVLGGDLESAIKNHLYFYNIWRKYQAIPERFDFVQQSVAISNYPLRPEFIESNYLLYRATKDPFYLQVGEMILRDLQKYTKTRCGWASLQSVVDKRLEDRMESFALSETIKYLYLLFDEENVLHQGLKDSNFVFSTEGHVLKLSSKYLDRGNHPSNNQPYGLTNSQHESYHYQYTKQSLPTATHGKIDVENLKSGPMCRPYLMPETFVKSIPYRPDADFARQMVGTREDHRDLLEADPKGYCEKPTLDVEKVVVEFVGPPKKTFFEDESSDINEIERAESRAKESKETKQLMVIPIKKGVFVNRIVGVKMQIQYDGLQNGYRAVRVADYPLSLNCNIYVEQSSMQPLWDSYQRSQDAYLRIFIPNPSDASSDVPVKDFLITPADFGYWRPRVLDYSQQPAFNSHHAPNTNRFDKQWHQPLTHLTTTATKRITAKSLIRIQENANGCRPYTTSQSKRIQDKIMVVDRGGCLFILKAYYAQAAGAHSIVVINTEEGSFAMTGAGGGSAGSIVKGVGEGIRDDDIDIHAVMISRSDGRVLLDWIRENESSSGVASSDSQVDDERISGLTAGFVQRKVTKDQIASARLSYNSLPIINVFSISNVPVDTLG